MRGFLLVAALSALFPFQAPGVGKEATSPKVERLDSVVVLSRAGNNTPVAFTMVDKKELDRSNPINSVPMNLSMQPAAAVSVAIIIWVRFLHCSTPQFLVYAAAAAAKSLQ